jgi:hypothetical protein
MSYDDHLRELAAAGQGLQIVRILARQLLEVRSALRTYVKVCTCEYDAMRRTAETMEYTGKCSLCVAALGALKDVE